MPTAHFLAGWEQRRCLSAWAIRLSNFMSLTKKLVLTFLLVTLIPIGVIIWVSRQSLVEQAQQQIGTQLKESVVQNLCSIPSIMFKRWRQTLI
jgi:hypothetical protein